MGASKRELERQQDLEAAAIEIHRKAGNIEDSTDNVSCNNGNEDLEYAYRVASKMWKNEDSLVSSANSHRELMDAVKGCLDSLSNVAEQNAAHFERF